jgi:hypothetical protein
MWYNFQNHLEVAGAGWEGDSIMKRILLVLGVIVCIGMAGRGPAGACGDKLVDISQGVKFQRALGLEPAAILLYVNPEAPQRQIKRLRASLTRVGHHVVLVDDWQVALEALDGEDYDLVIAELSEVASLESMLIGGTSPPLLLPFVFDGTDAELDDAQNDYPYVLSVPGRDNEQILTVNAAIKARADMAASTL